MNHNQQQNQNPQPNMQTGSGLTRYRSAPSSYFSSFLNNNGGFGTDDLEQLFNPRASSPETQRIFSRFMNSSDSLQENYSSDISVHPQPQSQQTQLNSQFLQPAKMESEVVQHPQLQRQQSNDFSSVSHMMYQSQNHEPSSPSVDNSYNRLMGSINSNRMAQGGGGGGAGLIRHSSSPAGLFADIDIVRELGAIRGMGSFGAGNSTNAEPWFSSASRFSSRISSSSGMMAPISEIGNKDIGKNIQIDDGQFDEDHDDDFISGFTLNSWDDSSILSDNFLNGPTDNQSKPFSNTNVLNHDQNRENGNRSRTLLSRHLSLPQTSADFSAVENFLQDSVPCKVRAKRGCATHPRSIAERVRRTKISQRMRKLQELVPNMEKQTNTADMLDLAVDYIKDLQREVKKLSDSRARCSCSAKEHP